MSWASSSPTHFQTGVSKSHIEQLKERHYFQYLRYFRYLGFFDLVFTLVGIFWSIQVLIMNTGASMDEADPKWFFKDTSSLRRCLSITLIGVFVMTAIQYLMQLVQLAAHLQDNDSNFKFMAIQDRPDPEGINYEHVSFQIDKQQRLLMRQVLFQSLTGRKVAEGEAVVNTGLYKFATNQRYFDSLQSNTLVADQEPIARKQQNEELEQFD